MIMEGTGREERSEKRIQIENQPDADLINRQFESGPQMCFGRRSSAADGPGMEDWYEVCKKEERSHLYGF